MNGSYCIFFSIEFSLFLNVQSDVDEEDEDDDDDDEEDFEPRRSSRTKKPVLKVETKQKRKKR